MKSKSRYLTILMIAALLLICGVLSNYAEAGGLWWHNSQGINEFQWNLGRSDINGEVGYPPTIFAPVAYCNGDMNGWTSSHRIVSGQLPPGLHFRCDSPSSRSGCHVVEGIPTEPGHWIVRVELYDVQCGGSRYDGFVQELRFHITGTGKVNQ